MTLVKNDVPTIGERRQFSYTEFHPPFSDGSSIKWYYRDSKGKLHSGITFSVADAKAEAAKQSGEEITEAPNRSVSKQGGAV